MQAVDLLFKLEELTPEQLEQQVTIEFEAKISSDVSNDGKCIVRLILLNDNEVLMEELF